MPAVLLVAILLLLSTPGARAEHRLPSVHLVIDIRNSGVTIPSVVAAALDEASEIWAPYGVRVTGSSRGRRDGADHEGPVVRATLELAEAEARRDPLMTPLGFTPFSADGQPLTTIAIFYDAVVRTVGESALFGQREVQSSSILREQLLARILGRTMAHELGHLLLETPSHSDSGLMRIPVRNRAGPSRQKRLCARGERCRASARHSETTRASQMMTTIRTRIVRRAEASA